MYITDLTRFLDEKGAVPQCRRGAPPCLVSRTSRGGQAAAIDGQRGVSPQQVQEGIVILKIVPDDPIERSRENCGHDGRISNWRRSFWDLAVRPAKR
jgi:hypothetical protein